MPLRCEIIKDIHLVIFEIIDQVTLDEVIDVFNQLQTDPDFSFSHDYLWDARKLTLAWSSSDVMRISAYLNSFKVEKRPKPKRALLFSRNVDYGLGRVYEVYRSSRNDVDIHVFKDRDEALSWLEVQDHPIFRLDGKYSE
jgi:hypothetical protein